MISRFCSSKWTSSVDLSDSFFLMPIIKNALRTSQQVLQQRVLNWRRKSGKKCTLIQCLLLWTLVAVHKTWVRLVQVIDVPLVIICAHFPPSCEWKCKFTRFFSLLSTLDIKMKNFSWHNTTFFGWCFFPFEILCDMKKNSKTIESCTEKNEIQVKWMNLMYTQCMQMLPCRSRHHRHCRQWFVYIGQSETNVIKLKMKEKKLHLHDYLY